MRISRYELQPKQNLDRASNQWTGGVLIDGRFDVIKRATYHYLQSVKTESDTFRWINDATVPYPQPFLDIPPGGHKVRTTAGGVMFGDSRSDYLPWYDPAGRRFPGFLDIPRDYLLLAKQQNDRKLEWAFETWLVCVIADMHDNDNRARDDTYVVAPLLGWQWGYEIAYNDLRPIGTDNPDDFVISTRAFGFVMTPSADWVQALSAKYGAGANQDFWNIATGNCVDCFPRRVTEPSTLLLLIAPAIALALRCGRIASRPVGRRRVAGPEAGTFAGMSGAVLLGIRVPPVT